MTDESDAHDGEVAHLKFDYPNVGYVIDGEEDATVRYDLEREFAEGDIVKLLTPGGNVFARVVIEEVWTAEVRHVYSDMTFVDDRNHPTTSATHLLGALRDHYPDAEIDMQTTVTVLYFDLAKNGEPSGGRLMADGGTDGEVAQLDIITTGRPDLTELAESYGCLRGTRLDDEPRYRDRGVRVDFLDVHWDDPDFEALVDAAEWHAPKYVVAGDYDGSNYELIHERARRLREHAENVIVVPHEPGEVERVPEWCVVGYSTPTGYAGTDAPVWEYWGRNIHILGGTPHQQLDILGYLSDDVVSIDGNSYHKAATIGAKYWTADPSHHWHKVDRDGPEAVVEAYRRSIDNWVGALQEVTARV